MSISIMRTILLIFVLFCSSSFVCAKENLTSVNFNWFVENYEIINETLKSGTHFETVSVVNTLGAIWLHRDGAVWVEVSPSIANALMYQNSLMLTWFEKYPDAWNSWLNDFSTAIFTNWTGTEQENIKLHRQLVDMRSQITRQLKINIDSKHKIMNKALLDILEKTEVREID